ncbi:hypothetical protein HDV02_005753 [Globomyces sp. JEL0801]|nr:hypothetical protein HDV02_005753 [Globomyces sp. JEL0801]
MPSSRQKILNLLLAEKAIYSRDISPIIPDLSRLLDYFEPPSNNSLLELNSGKYKNLIDDRYKSIAIKLSNNLELDQIIAMWNLINYKKTNSGFTVDSDQTILEYATQFYYQERLATIDLLTALFRFRTDSTCFIANEIDQICIDIMNKDGNHRLQQKALSTFTALVNKTMPLKVQLASESAAEWCIQNLREQKALLELQIMLYYTEYPTAVESQNVLKSLLSVKIGFMQVNRPFFDKTGNALFQEICDLCSILMTEVLNFEILFERITPSSSDSSKLETIFDDSTILQSLDNEIWTSFDDYHSNGDDPVPSSVLAIAWASYTQLVSILLSHRCPAQYTDFFEQIAQSYAESRTPQRLFQFGYSDAKALDYLIRSLLDAVQRAFPIYFEDFTSLIESLISSPVSAKAGFEYLNAMSTFADFARESDYQQSFEQKGGTTIWTWKGTCLIKGAPFINLIPRIGTEAYEMGSNVVLLSYSYSAWHLVLSYLDSFLHASQSDIHGLNSHFGTIKTTHSILKIVNRILQFGDEETVLDLLQVLTDNAPREQYFGTSPATILSGFVGEILNRCCSPGKVHLELITECLNTMKFLLRYHPDTIWSRLRVQRLLPQYSISSAGQYGYIQQYVLPNESSLGTYYSTIAFLELVKELVIVSEALTVNGSDKQSGSNEFHSLQELIWVKSDILYSCITFIIRDVFPVYASWRYVHIHQKFQIGLIILTILNNIMNDTTWYFEQIDESHKEKSEKKVSLVQKLVIEYFVSTANIYQILPLLDIVAYGNSTPLGYHVSGRRREAITIEYSITEGLKLLKNFFVLLMQTDVPISTLESTLLDRTVQLPNGKTTEFVHIIASYIDYQSDDNFALLATETLTLLCRLSSRAGRQPTSFMGYFGADAFSLVSSFVELAKSRRNPNSKTTELVQMSIYSFVTALIESQPALAAMFLNGYDSEILPKKISDKEQSKDSINESSILTPVVSTILNWKTHLDSRTTVLASAINLLGSIWESAREHIATINKLRVKADLWKCLSDILLYETEELNDENCTALCYLKLSQAHIIRLFAIEAYHMVCNSKKIGATDSKSLILQTLKKTLVTKDVPFGQEQLIYNPALTRQIQDLCEKVNPPVSIEHYRRIAWNGMFDSERIAGNDFMYNQMVWVQKTYSIMDFKTVDICILIGELLMKVNVNWSLTDVQMTIVKNSRFAVTLMTSNIWNESKEGHLTKDELLKLINVNVKNLKKTNSQKYIFQQQKVELSCTLVFLITRWIDVIKAEIDSSHHRNNILDLLTELEKSLAVSELPLGPIGTFSEYEYHLHVLSSILILCQALAKKPTQDVQMKNRIDHIYSLLLPTVCQGLYFIFTGPSPSNQQSVNLALSLLFELTRKGSGASISVWLPVLQRFNTFSLFLNYFESWNYQLDDKLPIQVLEILLSFASHSRAALPLYTCGIIATFCNNPYSSLLSEGKVEGYSKSEENPVHRIWCLMLAIASELLSFLATEIEFVESICGFLRFYQPQIAISLQTDSEITIASLQETENVAKLFYTLCASYDDRRRKLTLEQEHQLPEYCLLLEFQESALRLLVTYVFLFKNPQSQSYKFRPVTRQERTDSLVDVKDKPVTPNTRSNYLSAAQCTTKLKAKMDNMMFSITRHCIAILRISSKSEASLMGTGLSPLLFNPSLSQGEMGASFGTLFDLLRYIIQLLRQSYESSPNQPGTTKITSLIYFCEGTLTLLSAQLKQLELEDAEVINDLRQEFDSTIIELSQLFQETSQSWKSPVVIDAKDYMMVLKSLVNTIYD